MPSVTHCLRSSARLFLFGAINSPSHILQSSRLHIILYSTQSSKEGGIITRPDLKDVIQTHGSDITKYCYNLLWDYHEAHDAAQEVFIKIMSRLDSFEEVGLIKPWLYRVAYTTCIDILRRRKLARLFVAKESGLRDGVHLDSYNLGISQRLKDALSQLSVKDRALVYNRAVAQMEYSELESIYDAKSATLRKRYERARKKLEKYLLEEDNEEFRRIN